MQIANAQKLKSQGDKHFKDGKFDDAIEKYKQACSIDPNVPTYWSIMLRCYKNLKLYPEMADVARTVIRVDRHLDGYHCLAQAQKAMNNLEGCIETLDSGLRIDASDSQLKSMKNEVKFIASYSENTKLSPTLLREKDIAFEQIVSLVEDLAPLLMGELPSVYQKKFGTSLTKKYKQFGHSKLIEMVSSIPTIDFQTFESQPYLILRGYRCESKQQRWLKQAIDHWVHKTIQSLKEINKTNRGDPKPIQNIERWVSEEATKNKTLRPRDIPDVKTYVKKVTKALRTDARFCVQHSKGGVENFYLANGMKHSDPSPHYPEVKVEENGFVEVQEAFDQMDLSKIQTCLSGFDYQEETSEETSKTEETSLSVSSQAKELLQEYFSVPKRAGSDIGSYGITITDKWDASNMEEKVLLGYLANGSTDTCNVTEEQNDHRIYMNTHEPFCFAAVGVQGTGKSHTLSCILESCLLPYQIDGIIHLKNPMTTLVLHYDQNTGSVCEATGLMLPARDLEGVFKPLSQSPLCMPRSEVILLVSPTYYRQRKAFYGGSCTVRPLLFQWSTLTADHIKRIMRIVEGDTQLYVASFMSLLRRYQRKSVVPDFENFVEEVKSMCNVKGQQGPLDQRISLLESMVAESDVNKDLREESFDLTESYRSGHHLIVADLTDPLLSKEEVNGLFQVLTEQFRALPTKGGKLLALDEAHKFMDGVKSDGLSEAIVDVARLMRHDGMRLAVSTQSPKALAPELLELVTVAVLHQFHSRDWWTYLENKLPLPNAGWENVLSLEPGNALVFASRHDLPEEATDHASHAFRLRIRPRITSDLGFSKTNIR